MTRHCSTPTVQYCMSMECPHFCAPQLTSRLRRIRGGRGWCQRRSIAGSAGGRGGTAAASRSCCPGPSPHRSPWCHSRTRWSCPHTLQATHLSIDIRRVDFCKSHDKSIGKDCKMRNTKIVDRVLLVIEGSTCEQQGGGQDSDQDQGGEESALGLGLHPGPGSSLVRGIMRGRWILTSTRQTQSGRWRCQHWGACWGYPRSSRWTGRSSRDSGSWSPPPAPWSTGWSQGWSLWWPSSPGRSCSAAEGWSRWGCCWRWQSGGWRATAPPALPAHSGTWWGPGLEDPC